MAATHMRFLSVLLAAVLLGACGERLDIEVKARLDGQPAAQAKVVVDREELGVTDAQGVLAKQIRKKAGAEIDVTVSKEMPGYRIEPWKSTFLVKLPKEGQTNTYRVEADLKAMRYVTLRASEKGAPLPEAKVTVGGKEAGVTDAKGEFVYLYRTQPAKGAEFNVTKTGYSPYRAVRRFEPGEGIEIALSRQAGQALATQLFKFPAFREVPGERLQAEVKQRKLSIDRIVAKGWQDTPLRASVDMIVLGSVAKDDDGYLAEVKFHTASGKIIFSEIARARSAGGVSGAVRDIVSNVIDRFPFEGTVIGAEDDRYRINIGRNWRIGRGTEFTLTTPTFGEGGKVAGYRETGRMEVRRGEDTSSLAEVAAPKKGEKVQIGDRVVRRTGREGEDGDRRTYFLLTAKGGVGTSVNALPGTNVYLNGEWKGATGANGQAEIPLRLGRSYTLMLYRHGYQQLTGKISVDKSGEAREFVLAANNSLFKVDSAPSSATVYIDDEQVGKTPIAGGKLVTLGFHSVRLTYGEDYRDFFEVMEFTKKEEDRTGERRIVLQKDLLKIGERARQKGDVEGAIKAYTATGRDHPDYAEAHRRLGDIYLDDKEDYDPAIAEFETVLALPENEQLIYKQFAVTFTNLGHAYCEKGNGLVNSDRDAASKNFAKAIKALQTAKQT